VRAKECRFRAAVFDALHRNATDRLIRFAAANAQKNLRLISVKRSPASFYPAWF
jgi:hypothetical protein